MILILTYLWSLVYFSDCLEKSEPKMPIDILFFNLFFISPYSRGRGYRKQSRGALSNAVTHFQMFPTVEIISTGGFKEEAGGHGPGLALLAARRSPSRTKQIEKKICSF